MKIVIILSLMFLGGCAQLMKGPPPDIPRLIDPEKKILLTECNGLTNNFGVCHQAAKQACPTGYEGVDSVTIPSNMTRQLIFKCK